MWKAPEVVSKNDLILMMDKQAAYDSQPRACRRMVRLVQGFPTEHVVDREVFLRLLAAYKEVRPLSPSEETTWKQMAGLI